MPMPPATNRYDTPATGGTSGKWLRGARMRRALPTATCACTCSEPPRPSGSRSTATR